MFHSTTKKYKEMVLDAAETVLGYFGFDRSVYGNIKKEEKSGLKNWENIRPET